MPPLRRFERVDTLELKSKLFKKLGRNRAEKYFRSLEKFLGYQMIKTEFDKICVETIGKENIKLHNVFIRSIINNACLSLGPLSKQAPTGDSRTSKVSSGPLGSAIPPSARRGRSITSRDRKFADRPSPLGPHGKAPPGHVVEVTNSCDVLRSREQQSAPELVSIGSKALLEVVSVEDGEEVEQVRSSPMCVQSRSPIRAPLGIPKVAAVPKAISDSLSEGICPSTSYSAEYCYSNGELPDSQSLQKLLEQKLQAVGLGISMECANALHAGLNTYLNKLIKSCLDLAKSRHDGKTTHPANGRTIAGTNVERQHRFASESSQYHHVSLQDLQVAVESNSRLLGCNFAVQREKISFRLSENK